MSPSARQRGDGLEGLSSEAAESGSEDHPLEIQHRRRPLRDPFDVAQGRKPAADTHRGGEDHLDGPDHTRGTVDLTVVGRQRPQETM